MQKKRINLAERYPRYFAATKRTEKIAEITDEQAITMASVDSRIAELEEELEALKASKASEDEKNSASEDEDEKKAAADEDEKEAKKAKSQESIKIAELESKLDKMMAILENKPATEGTVINTDARSEGGGNAPRKMMSSIELELERLHGVKSN
jgi:chromosome segregation ATPase